jgi:alpha-1,2-glucosyltransferase
MPVSLAIDVRSLLASTGYMLTCLLVAELVNGVVDRPYLVGDLREVSAEKVQCMLTRNVNLQDEIFHIPQAQRYCKGHFDYYDAKLTTPPGLYIISVGFAKVFAFVMRFIPFAAADSEGFSELCETLPQLRYTTLLALLLLPWLLSTYKYQRKTAPWRSPASDQVQVRKTITPTSPMEALTIAKADPAKSAQMVRNSVAIRQEAGYERQQSGTWAVIGDTLASLPLTAEVHTISLLPPLWLFGFLYYTDVPSTTIVMAMLSASKRGKPVLAAIVSCL